jgi:hypothetical protein
LYAGQGASVVVNASTNGFSEGMHSLGEIDFEGYMFGEESDPAYDQVSVSLYIGDVNRIYVSTVNR